MDSARKYVERGQIDKAIREYLRVVREDPKDVRVWLKIGDLYAKKGAKAEATETYLKVAKFYSEQGFYLKAVAVYKQILKLDPRLVEVNLKLAELYRQLGLLSDAMQHFEMVAGHFHREGKIKEALATVRQLVDLDPENIATRIKLAELYSKEGMIEEAVAEFTHACEYLRTHDRQDDFLKVAERLLWHKPDNVDLTRELASLYLQRGDPRRSLQKLQVCFKANPRDVETLALLAQAFQALEQREKTASVLKELARVLEENGERARAADVHRKILEYKPGDPDSIAYLEPERGGRGPAVPAQGSASQPRPAHPISIANELPPRSTRKTGSVPLLNPDAVSMFNRKPEFLQEPNEQPGGYESREVYEAPSFEDELVLDDEPSFEVSSAGEMHEEEIVKILTETDVYVKYGLHQKAIEHLRRVFELDPNNIEARERLKDILLSLGREDEAIAELMTLAEVTATFAPDQAEAYLREVLAINAAYPGVYELADRYRLPLSHGPETAPMSGGAVAPVEEELDFGDIELADSDLIPALADNAGSGRYHDAFDAVESLDFDLDESAIGQPGDPSAITVEVSAEQVEDMVEIVDESDDLDFGFTATSDESGGDTPVFEPGSASGYPVDPLGPDPSGPFLPEPELLEPPPPIDLDDAAAFEAAPISNAEIEGYGSDFIRDDAPNDDYAEFSDFSATNLSPPPELALEEAASAPGRRGGPRLDIDIPPTLDGSPVMETLDTDFDELEHGIQAVSSPQPASPAGSELEDDLDEADFFVQQGLFSEARDIVNTLLARYPNHPLLLSKLSEIDEQARHGDEGAAFGMGDPPTAEIGAVLRAQGGVEPIEDQKPTVLLEQPIDDEDADTHYDLGLAYKEMGLYEEAIKAFQKVTEVPGREVQCRIMIGLCQLERSNYSEAIHQFKAGLHVPSIIEREKLSLYYEIGAAYEALNDPREALYYYEMVIKKEPGYRDIADRVRRIESTLGAQPHGERVG